MKIENTVCTLKHGSIIGSVLTNIDTLFGWYIDPSDIRDTVVILKSEHKKATEQGWVYLYPAYNVSELGIILELLNNTHYSWFCTTGTKDQGKFYLFIVDDSTEEIVFESFKETEAETRADAVIWMIHQKIINTKELKL